MKTKTFQIALLALASSAACAGDPALSSQLQSLQDRWAQANYKLTEKEQMIAFEQLASDADALIASDPSDAQALVWRGIIKSTWAGAKGGLSALSLVKQAKVSLEQAMEIDADVLNGSAWTSLGSLYDQVPGWPIGFGSDKKARKFLLKGLELNPDGIDSNYFYALYLADDGEWNEAVDYLQRARQAPLRPGRLTADAGRKMEITEKLSEFQGHVR